MSAKFSLLKYILQCHIWKGENCDVIHALYSFKQRVCIELKWEVLKVTTVFIVIRGLRRQWSTK